MKLDELRSRILALEEFQRVLAELKTADPRNGGNIETALRACVRDLHAELAAMDLTSQQGRKLTRHLLYREGIELKAHAVPYLNYERELATRGEQLWRFALETTEQFFTLVFDALEEYFAAKTNVLVNEVDAEADWYTGLVDTGKKSGELVNLASRWLKHGADLLGEAELVSDLPEQAVDTRDVVQRAVDKHLAPDVLSEDLQKILEEASRRYVIAWTEKIKAETPNLSELKAFVFNSGDGAVFEFGAAEQTLALGVGGAVLGTVSLAAGWHTLAYAMVHVFYPAAIVVAIGAAGVAWMRKEQDQERRRQRIRETVDRYHRHCLLEIDTGKRAELGNKTLRQALVDQAETTVGATLGSWQHAISGNLTTAHYRRLAGALAAHLNLVHEFCKQLEESESSQTAWAGNA